jgi:hypothetical protein
VTLPWGLRWWELAPEVVLAAGLGLFVVTERSAATSAASSTTAIGLTAAAGAAWILARVVLVRFAPWPALRAAVFAVAAFAVLNVVVLSAYDNTTVVETLAPVMSVPGPAATAAGPAAAAAPADVPPATTAPTAASPAAPVRSGSLHGIDHRAEGRAALYRQADGSLVVGLEAIDIQPGPDYDVYVVPGAGREQPEGGTRLDDLRGNKGTQFYPVPVGADVSAGPWTVLVWCQTFDVPVAAATLD